MKISTKGTYALEIIVDLAMHSEPDRLASLKDIAQRRQLSEKYLERIAGSECIDRKSTRLNSSHCD